MITGDRDIFIGAHVTLETKARFYAEADRRKVSMSKLLSEVIEKFLETAAKEDLQEKRSNKRNKTIDGLRDIPLPLEPK